MSILSEIHLLPPRGHSARRLALALLIFAPFAFGALALFLGQDANWDLRNYHWYNAYAFINGRYGFDLLPSQTPYFYNPLLDVPFYLLATHVSAPLAGFILGCIQGLNFILLFMLAYVSLLISSSRNKVLICAALATLGMLGGGGIAQIGTTFYDNVTSLGLFLSALLVVRYIDALIFIPMPKVILRVCLFGIPAGIEMGLKLPAVVFCVGLCFAFLGTGGTWKRRFALCFAFGVGVLFGALLTYGYWGWFLDTHYDNPFFPYFNSFFKSPLAPLTSARDIQFVPNNWKDYFLFPYIFTDSPYRVGEIPWRDWRIVILYVLLPIALLLRLFFGRVKSRPDFIARPSAVRYLLWVAVISYFAWAGMFAVYRYALPLEMLAPLLIIFVVGLLPLKLSTRGMLSALLLAVVAFSIQPGNWTRRATWLNHFVEATIPRLSDTSNLMILMAGIEPYAHLVPEFPSDIAFVRIQSNFASPEQDKGFNDIIRKRVNEHKGLFMLLIPPWQHGVAKDALQPFRLALVPEPCQTVVDRLYDDKPMDLCRVMPLSPK